MIYQNFFRTDKLDCVCFVCVYLLTSILQPIKDQPVDLNFLAENMKDNLIAIFCVGLFFVYCFIAMSFVVITFFSAVKLGLLKFIYLFLFHFLLHSEMKVNPKCSLDFATLPKFCHAKKKSEKLEKIMNNLFTNENTE